MSGRLPPVALWTSSAAAISTITTTVRTFAFPFFIFPLSKDAALCHPDLPCTFPTDQRHPPHCRHQRPSSPSSTFAPKSALLFVFLLPFPQKEFFPDSPSGNFHSVRHPRGPSCRILDLLSIVGSSYRAASLVLSRHGSWTLSPASLSELLPAPGHTIWLAHHWAHHRISAAFVSFRASAWTSGLISIAFHLEIAVELSLTLRSHNAIPHQKQPILQPRVPTLPPSPCWRVCYGADGHVQSGTDYRQRTFGERACRHMLQVGGKPPSPSPSLLS